jgi:hypothetical protein
VISSRKAYSDAFTAMTASDQHGYAPVKNI